MNLLDIAHCFLDNEDSSALEPESSHLLKEEKSSEQALSTSDSMESAVSNKVAMEKLKSAMFDDLSEGKASHSYLGCMHDLLESTGTKNSRKIAGPQVRELLFREYIERVPGTSDLNPAYCRGRRWSDWVKFRSASYNNLMIDKITEVSSSYNNVDVSPLRLRSKFRRK